MNEYTKLFYLYNQINASLKETLKHVKEFEKEIQNPKYAALQKLFQDKEERILRKKELSDRKNQVRKIPLDILYYPINSLDLPMRAYRGLFEMGIQYIYQLIQLCPGHILRRKNMGRKTLNEIQTELFRIQLDLGMRLEDKHIESIKVKIKADELIQKELNEKELIEKYEEQVKQLNILKAQC